MVLRPITTWQLEKLNYKNMEVTDNQQAPEQQAPQAKQYPPINQVPILAKMLAIVGVFIAASILGSIAKIVLEKTSSCTPEFAGFIGYVIQLVLTIIFVWRQRISLGIKQLGVRFSTKGFNPTLILWGVILVFVTSTVLEPLLALFPDEYLKVLRNAVGVGGWAMITTIVAAPILEEILFRGMIQDTLVRHYGAMRGIIVAAAIFGIIHIIPQQAINAFFIGLILGYIYLKTKSLLPVIIIHAINNAISYTFMVIFPSQDDASTRQLLGNDTLYYIFYAICCVILIVSAINIFREIRKMQISEVSK